MPSASLAFADSRRASLPEAVARNVLSEKTPTKPSAPEALIGRPGLTTFDNIGSAPIRGVFARKGLAGDAAFIVCHDTAYLVAESGSVTALSGVIAGDDAVEMDGGLDADYNTVIRIATGSKLYKWVSDGTTVVDEGIAATSVAFWKGYWLYTEATSDAVYRQNPASSTWSPIDFASAEYAPDPNQGVRVFGELAALLGAASVEFWSLTGDGTAPMGPAGGLAFDMGCKAISGAKNCDGILVWPDKNGGVQLSNGGPPRNVATPSEVEIISRTAGADLVAGYVQTGSHPLYVLNCGSEATLVLDLSNERWTRFDSLGYDYWRPRFFANLNSTILAADRLSNTVWQIDPNARDDDGDEIIKQFCAFIEVEEGSLDLANVQVDCTSGDAPRTGQGSSPQIGMQISVDEEVYGPMRFRPLGVTGQRRPLPRWVGCGTIEAPGAVLKFQVSDPVGFRVSSVKYNVA